MSLLDDDDILFEEFDCYTWLPDFLRDYLINPLNVMNKKPIYLHYMAGDVLYVKRPNTEKQAWRFKKFESVPFVWVNYKTLPPTMSVGYNMNEGKCEDTNFFKPEVLSKVFISDEAVNHPKFEKFEKLCQDCNAKIITVKGVSTNVFKVTHPDVLIKGAHKWFDKYGRDL